MRGKGVHTADIFGGDDEEAVDDWCLVHIASRKLFALVTLAIRGTLLRTTSRIAHF